MRLNSIFMTISGFQYLILFLSNLVAIHPNLKKFAILVHFLNSIKFPIETAGVKVIINNLVHSILTFYISPSYPINHNQLNCLFNHINQSYSNVIITGDFNVHNMLWGSNSNDSRCSIIEKLLDLHNYDLIS